MSSNGPFGFDPDDFDRVIREAGEGLRDAVGKFLDMTGERAGWSVLFDEFSRRQRREPETTGETGDGVWAIYTVDEHGGAHVEEVYSDRTRRVARQQEQHRPGAQGALPSVRHRRQRAGLLAGRLDASDASE